MARLIDRLSRRAGTMTPLPDPESVAWWSSTWGEQDRTSLPQTYDSYASNAVMANATVFACAQARAALLAQAEFKFQNLSDRRLYGNESLRVLEYPWPNGTAGDLFTRMSQQVDIMGNAFVVRRPDRLEVLRADRVQVIRVDVKDGSDRTYEDIIGYFYWEDGLGQGEAQVFDVSEVAHWYPVPDPLSPFRGMSWLTPVLREINADRSMTEHRVRFFENAATPNLMLKYQQRLTNEQLGRIRAAWDAKFAGSGNSGGTVVLDNGADLTVVGSTFESMRFTEVQAAGEARIAQAAGVPPIVAGLQAGLDAATYSNYGMALKAFAMGTMSYLWQSAVAALGKLVDVPAGSRLWFDTSTIAALQETETDRATSAKVFAEATNTLITAGFEPASITSALIAGDMALLKHTGMVSVQLQQPGAGAPATPTPKPDAAMPMAAAGGTTP